MVCLSSRLYIAELSFPQFKRLVNSQEPQKMLVWLGYVFNEHNLKVRRCHLPFFAKWRKLAGWLKAPPGSTLDTAPGLRTKIPRFQPLVSTASLHPYTEEYCRDEWMKLYDVPW